MAGTRETIEPTPGDKRYARRDAQGQFTEQDDAGKAAAQDQRRQSKSESKPGQGDKGDRKKR